MPQHQAPLLCTRIAAGALSNAIQRLSGLLRTWLGNQGLAFSFACIAERPLLLPKRALQRRHETSAPSLSSFEADLRPCLNEILALTSRPPAMHMDRSKGTIECLAKAVRPAATLACKPRPGLQHRLYCQVAFLLPKRALQSKHQTSAPSLSSFEAGRRLCLKETVALT